MKTPMMPMMAWIMMARMKMIELDLYFLDLPGCSVKNKTHLGLSAQGAVNPFMDSHHDKTPEF